MELFDKKYVHFMWEDELEGKRGFFADSIETLKSFVETKNLKNLEPQYYNTVSYSGNGHYPFCSDDYCKFIFFYYDPNYECKKAYAEGKQIQIRCKTCDDSWIDCDEPEWFDSIEYRIKPEEHEYKGFSLKSILKAGIEHLPETYMSDEDKEHVTKSIDILFGNNC